MGSFTQGLLAITFSESTPDEVLAAFAAFEVPSRRSAAPLLPPPVVEAWKDWSPYSERPVPDPYEDQPWRHDWSREVDGVLRFSGSRWQLFCTFMWKTDPRTSSEALEWLAPFVATQWKPRGQLVGHVHHEYDPAPHLLWVEAGAWERQDMNPEGYIAP